MRKIKSTIWIILSVYALSTLFLATVAYAQVDTDSDLYFDEIDNCPFVFNHMYNVYIFCKNISLLY